MGDRTVEVIFRADAASRGAGAGEGMVGGEGGRGGGGEGEEGEGRVVDGARTSQQQAGVCKHA